MADLKGFAELSGSDSVGSREESDGARLAGGEVECVLGEDAVNPGVQGDEERGVVGRDVELERAAGFSAGDAADVGVREFEVFEGREEGGVLGVEVLGVGCEGE